MDYSEDSVLPINQKILTQSILVSLDFNQNEIIKIIRALNIHKARAHVNISIRMIKQLLQITFKTIILLFQNSSKLSYYPDIW